MRAASSRPVTRSCTRNTGEPTDVLTAVFDRPESLSPHMTKGTKRKGQVETEDTPKRPVHHYEDDTLDFIRAKNAGKDGWMRQARRAGLKTALVLSQSHHVEPG